MESGCADESEYGSYESPSLNRELNSSFGGNQAAMANNYSHKPVLAPMKVFTCKYCARKFLNSRALGGHQNAHKKERTIWMTGMPSHKSLGMEPHSVLHKPVQEEPSTGKAKQSFRRFREAWRQQMFEEAADQDCWPGSFYVHSTESYGPEPDTEATKASNRSKRTQETSIPRETRDLELTGSSLTDLVLSPQPDQSNVHSLDLDLHL